MTRMRRLGVALLVVSVGLLATRVACAGSVADCLTDAKPAYYSPTQYWTPGAVYYYECLCGPRLGVYANNLHPEIPPTVVVLKYSRRFPAPLPVATLIPVPTPPPESKAR